MAEQIHRYVHGCHICQRDKNSSVKPAGLLQPLAVPDEAWDRITTDFSTGLPQTKAGNDSILVFVDRLTKYVHVHLLELHVLQKIGLNCSLHVLFCTTDCPKAYCQTEVVSWPFQSSACKTIELIMGLDNSI